MTRTIPPPPRISNYFSQLGPVVRNWRVWLKACLLVLSCGLVTPALAQDSTCGGDMIPATRTCTVADPVPTPTEVDISTLTVPLAVPSTAADYFVLYVTHTVETVMTEVPVAVVSGQEGTTSLSEHIPALAVTR